MSDLAKIKDAYIHYRYLLDGQLGEFPYGTDPVTLGGTHLEIADDGTMALITTERDEETKRRETKSIKELMYFVFKARVNALSFRARPPLPDPKANAIALMRKMDPDWADRLAREQVEETKETAEKMRRLREQ